MNKLKIEPSEYIEETLFLTGIFDLEDFDAAYDHLTDFCIDKAGRVRISGGIVAPFDQPDNMNFVPVERFELRSAPWNSHQAYLEVDLPNPALNFEYYYKIRTIMLAELQRRIDTL